jgi:hypothetical protein
MKNFQRLIFLLGLFVPGTAYAMCPVCTVAVGAGIGLSRWLGVDDTVTGLWIGAIIISMSMWTINWLEKKKIKFIIRDLSVYAVYIAAIFIPLYYKDIIGHPLNQLWGIDKLALGMAVGAVAFYLTAGMYLAMKKRHDNHAHFPFQKIVMTVGILILLSGIFYLVTK